ncbi:MAG: MOSC N-terminal beta barrel domain-containing protein [Pseudomonadota bacterium]
MKISALNLFPVKSTRANSVDRAEVSARGLVGDRRWMLVDESQRFVTGRTMPDLVRISTSQSGNGLTLQFEGEELRVEEPSAAASKVVVWRDTVDARDAGDIAATWLSERLGRAVRLVFQSDTDHRILSEDKCAQPGDEVSFADGYPVLLIGTASLDALNSALSVPVSMSHFRPNIVVETEVPYVEDTWSEVLLGEVAFAVSSQCTRCIFTTVDPATGVLHPDKEPLRTLLRERRRSSDGKPVFGVNLIPLGMGEVQVEDAVNPR